MNFDIGKVQEFRRNNIQKTPLEDFEGITLISLLHVMTAPQKALADEQNVLGASEL